MAALGAVVQHYVKFPGFESVPSGLAASITAPGSYGFVALFAVSGILELGAWTESDNKEPGNFGDPLGLNQYNQEMREARQQNSPLQVQVLLHVPSDLVGSSPYRLTQDLFPSREERRQPVGM